MQAQVSEFPFVSQLPKREKGKLARLWDAFEEIRAAGREHGTLLPQFYVATLLDISKQRVHQLVQDGRLQSVEVGGIPYVTEKSLVDWAQAEHRSGRPMKSPGAVEIVKRSARFVRECQVK